MYSLLKQIKKRRLELELKQKDMYMRIGVSRQQYQHLESKGNPRLNTLELVAKGLNCELLLIPREKLNIVNGILADKESESTSKSVSSEDLMFKDFSDLYSIESHEYSESTEKRKNPRSSVQEEDLSENPWKGLLGDDE